ncbi:hypothetical protein O6H91_12G013300 [Diphasiastrum complanatum]|uniref:Uncharacterized protein n=1 Tax=Diphasiastrum complanatum TaxID=34168 RepID=A0ACC2BYW2_DIPCM|nr:hypothetical protein O6H91_12G013300 [Diphasiastrum complanatum]
MGEDTPVSKMGTSGGRSESRAHDDGGGHTSEHDGHQRWQIRESRTPSETNLKPRHLPALRPDEIAASYCKIALEKRLMALEKRLRFWQRLGCSLETQTGEIGRLVPRIRVLSDQLFFCSLTVGEIC